MKTFAKRVSPSSHLVGLISDTHGLIRPEALDALRDSDLIIHCGDVGDPAVLDVLRSIAPVRAVRGNNDIGACARSLPADDVVKLTVIKSTSCIICRSSTLIRMPRDSRLSSPAIRISPLIEKRHGILFINPGSAGPRRFKLPTTVAILTIRSRHCAARIVQLSLSQQIRTRRNITG